MTAVFKADEDETAARYSVSEWWLEPGADGPGAHAHESNDEIFYVIAGTVSFLAGEDWLDAPQGTFLRIPAGVTGSVAQIGLRPRFPFPRTDLSHSFR
ncbi:cupin domain-containing protein, partial [Paracoccus sp. AS002]|uniref:cupin domain-containing protein n=1 Tax=Paracoccus sp. AS002 TaxID=3019545 RepID=UPI0023E85546